MKKRIIQNHKIIDIFSKHVIVVVTSLLIMLFLYFTIVEKYFNESTLYNNYEYIIAPSMIFLLFIITMVFLFYFQNKILLEIEISKNKITFQPNVFPIFHHERTTIKKDEIDNVEIIKKFIGNTLKISDKYDHQYFFNHVADNIIEEINDFLSTNDE